MPDGQGLLIGWYDINPGYQPELDQWHSQEHMPERARLPGFLTAARYRSLRRTDRYCLLFRTTGIDAFGSKPYLDVLNNPTAWTRKMMPGVLSMNRSLCRVAESRGGGFGGMLHTMKCSPAPDERVAFADWLSEEAFPAILSIFGIVRLELAIADQDASRLKTRDQDLRQRPDEIADWVVVMETYTEEALGALSESALLAAREFEAHGATAMEVESFQLVHLISST
jgi:hypothetical protein